MSDHPIYITGHSLGGSEAYLYAFSRLMRGLRADGVYAFAPARPGDNYIGQCFAAHPEVVIQAFRNHRDIVPELPVARKLLHERYEQPILLTELDEPGGDPFKDHSSELYLRGALKLPKTNAPVSAAQAATAVVHLYNTPTGWDWINAIDGQYWAMKVLENGARLLVARGTHVPLDILRDAEVDQVKVMGARVSRGFWKGVESVQDELDAQLL